MSEQTRQNSSVGVMQIPGIRQAFGGGLLAGLLALVGQLLVGGILRDVTPRAPLEAALPSMRFIGSSVITASSTILALILTVVGLTRRIDNEFSAEHYERIRLLAIINVALLMGSMLLLIVLSVPVGESVSITPQWYTAAYVVYIVLTSSVSGGFVTAAFMLYYAIDSLLEVVHPQ
ncbi:MAG: hypothetical protein ACFB51_10185 [Anaerolineae bacterium]